MAERVEGLVGERVAKGMWILTFHSMCARLLRREHTHLGVPSGFTIYDDGDTERLIRGILQGSRPRSEAVRAARDGQRRSARAKDQVIDAGRVRRDRLATTTRRRSPRSSPPTSAQAARQARSTSTT